jgi:hypothetical protein
LNSKEPKQRNREREREREEKTERKEYFLIFFKKRTPKK